MEEQLNDQLPGDKKGENQEAKEGAPLARLPWGWIALIGIFVFGAVIVYAVPNGHVMMAQGAILAILALILFGSALLTRNFALSLIPPAGPDLESVGKPRTEIEREIEEENERRRSAFLMRLVVLAALGLGAIILYAIQYENWHPARVASTASVGLMAAGASWLAGALLGFLFGIPHAIEGTRSSENSEKPPGYLPNTSLEQISDWLTKIIVGVGLVQLNKIPAKLNDLASFIATGMDSSHSNTTLGLAIFVYFSISGFLFGFLWGRLYMTRAFQAAGKS